MNNREVISGEIIIIGGIIFFITGIGIYLLLKNTNKPKPKQFTKLLYKPVVEIDKFIYEFNTMINNFKKKSISYFLYRESQKNKLTEEKTNEMILKYGKIVAAPDLDILEYFGYLNENYYKVDDYLIEYLKNNEFLKYTDLLPIDRLKRNIMDESEKKAKEIIKNYL